MADFDTEFARRHHVALGGIHTALGLDYLVIDCAETRDGKLLFSKIDTGAVIHAMDPVDIFPYKGPANEEGVCSLLRHARRCCLCMPKGLRPLIEEACRLPVKLLLEGGDARILSASAPTNTAAGLIRRGSAIICLFNGIHHICIRICCR